MSSKLIEFDTVHIGNLHLLLSVRYRDDLTLAPLTDASHASLMQPATVAGHNIITDYIAPPPKRSASFTQLVRSTEWRGVGWRG